MLMLRRSRDLGLRSASVCPTAQRWFSKDYSSSDDEKKAPKAKKAAKKEEPAPAESAANESASSRLNRLLASMNTDDNSLTKHAAPAAGAVRPGDAVRKRKEAAKRDSNNKDVLQAAKRVASLLGNGNTTAEKKTESELLAKLLNQDATSGGAGQTEKPDKDSKKNAPESELSLSDLIVGMKIDRRQQQNEQARGDFVRRTLSQRQQGGGSRTGYQSKNQKKFQSGPGAARTAETYTGSVNLFGSEPLGIFKAPAASASADLLATWSQLEQRELKSLVTHPPANYYEKLAVWTEQGKLWRFPVDNEQDWSHETDVDFAEHIFLDQHLEGWCPTRGPIRHFMELVCVGLSKNPYITAQEKREHIFWYRDYFNEKKSLLGDLMEQQQQAQRKETKQVEA